MVYDSILIILTSYSFKKRYNNSIGIWYCLKCLLLTDITRNPLFTSHEISVYYFITIYYINIHAINCFFNRSLLNDNGLP